ncbi:hypothetical protein H8959_015900 [Pygathrix nigripes]
MQKHRVVAWLSQHNFPHGVVSFCDGLTHDPLRQKAVFLQSLVQEVELNIVAGYGSPKDVAVYAALGLSPSQTYIVGRAVRKLQAQCQTATWPIWASWKRARTRMPPRDPQGLPWANSYGVAAPVDFLRKQSQLLRSRGPSQVEREGPGTPPTTLARGKARSISLKLDRGVRPTPRLDLGYLLTHPRGQRGCMWEAGDPDLGPQR